MPFFLSTFQEESDQVCLLAVIYIKTTISLEVWRQLVYCEIVLQVAVVVLLKKVNENAYQYWAFKACDSWVFKGCCLRNVSSWASTIRCGSSVLVVIKLECRKTPNNPYPMLLSLFCLLEAFSSGSFFLSGLLRRCTVATNILDHSSHSSWLPSKEFRLGLGSWLLSLDLSLLDDRGLLEQLPYSKHLLKCYFWVCVFLFIFRTFSVIVVCLFRFIWSVKPWR